MSTEETANDTVLQDRQLSAVTTVTDNRLFSGESLPPDLEPSPQPVTTVTDKTGFSQKVSVPVSDSQSPVTDETAKEVNFYDFLL